MQQKEEISQILSNFEINDVQNKVILYLNPKIFPEAVVKKVTAKFEDKAWAVIDGDDEELLVELKPKQSTDLEILGREFNNVLINESTKEINVDHSNKDLVSKIQSVVKEFVVEEKGAISKQSVIAIGALLTGVGIALPSVDASHLCGNGDGGGGRDGGGGCGGGGSGGGSSSGGGSDRDGNPM